jgi:hypothetical protein
LLRLRRQRQQRHVGEKVRPDFDLEEEGEKNGAKN